MTTRLEERRRRRWIRRIGAAAVVVGMTGAVAGLVAPSYPGHPASAFPAPTTTDHVDGIRPIDRIPAAKTKEPPDADASVTPAPTAGPTTRDRHADTHTADPTPTRTRGTGRTSGPVAGESTGGADVAPGTSAAGSPVGGEPDPGDSSPPASTGDDVVDLTNAERAKAGCAPLTIDPALDASAQSWSDEQAVADAMSHSPGAGVTYGENVAVGYETAAEVMAGWMASPGHRANILNCDYRTIGTGYTADDTGPYWTQQFGL